MPRQVKILVGAPVPVVTVDGEVIPSTFHLYDNGALVATVTSGIYEITIDLSPRGGVKVIYNSEGES